MKAVLDASVALKMVLIEPDSQKTKTLRDEFQMQRHELLAPDVFEVEVAHALTRAERQGRIPIGHAIILWSDVLAAPPEIHPSSPLVPRAIDISSSTRLGVYDCLYVALAEREECELITADEKLVKKIQATFPFITSLSSLP